jgi:hypothetical protein
VDISSRTLVRQTNKTLVIPNRAESPLRNLLSADATTTGRERPQIAPQASKPTHAQPWKSGASAPRKAPKEATGLQPPWTPFARILVRQTNKTLVIPNRAESPVRNLMSADATTNGKGATSDRPASLKTDACTTVEERRFSAA